LYSSSHHGARGKTVPISELPGRIADLLSALPAEGMSASAALAISHVTALGVTGM
jgi:hypothetical protein